MKNFCVILFVCMVLTSFACEKMQEQSSRELPLPRSAFRSSIVPRHMPDTVQQGEVFFIPVSIKNLGDEKWPSLRYLDGKFIVTVAYVVIDSSGKIIREGDRTMLKYDMWPEEEMSLDVRIQAPMRVGKFKITLDLIQEGVAWFSYFDPMQSAPSFEIIVK